MQAKELMIGDWVEFNSESMKAIFNCRVTEVGKDYVKTDRTGGDEIVEEDIFPILLDDEILHKNFPDDANPEGSRINFHVGVTWDLEEGRKVWIGRWWNGYTESIRRKSGESITDGWWEIVAYEPSQYEHGTKFRFVHELQHALRLFGIEKEIKV